MNRFILIFLLTLLSSTLSADHSYIKMKTALTKGVYHAKIGFFPEEGTFLKRNKDQYISHIVADINNKVIYDVWTSPLISPYPRLKFKFNYSGESSTVNLKVYNNNNLLEKRIFLLNDEKSTPIKESSKSIVKDVVNFPSKVWKTSTVNEGIHELYGEYRVSKRY